jgi:PelA/Pel-15E family pectate lyase
MLSRLIVIASIVTVAADAAVIGTNPPALPLTETRLAQLPAAEQPVWRAYLQRSVQLRLADQQSMAHELKAAGLKEALVPRSLHGAGHRMLGEDDAWYATAEARRMADNVASFQTPAGGWSKNFDPTDHPRRPGEGYSHDNNSQFLTDGDNDRPADPRWSYIGTFDNDATTTELRFLAKVAAAADEKTGAHWRAAFRRGLEYIYTAQYPNGGWPQVFPLDGGYHDEITFNDNAMINVVELLRDVAAREPDFAWLTGDERKRAGVATERALRCILACQIRVGGRRVAWCQQHDVLTLAPTSARNYEMPSLASGESAAIVTFLMSLNNPSREIVAAVNGAAHWLEKTAVPNVTWKPAPDGSGRALLRDPGHSPMWPRYSEIGTDRPIFGDRDKTIHDRVEEISKERRNGYGWYGDGPKRVLEHYAKWARSHPG